MKVLVTGGAGFIGSNIVDRLLDDGYEVIAIDNESSESHENFYWNKNAENYKIDICEYEDLNVCMKDVDIVFHLAAESSISSSIQNPILAIQTNTLGTCNVLQSARIFASTTSLTYV